MVARVRGHWDAFGHPILDFYGMREYYKSDKYSTYVLSEFLPHAFVAEPAIIVSFSKNEPERMFVDRVYPAGSTKKELLVGKMAVSFFRNVWCKRPEKWTCSRVGDWFFFSKKGFLRPVSSLYNKDNW